VPVLSSGDPEVTWRLADALALQGRHDEAATQRGVAPCRFEELLARHRLAFADHGAEFYAGSGNDAARALDLARTNVANRPTLRAYEQAYAIAVDADEADAATELMAEATQRWGSTDAFRRSALAISYRQPIPKGIPV
jgi:serine/threonine protein kinase HipA of HipAB toxin-antitoxin module